MVGQIYYSIDKEPEICAKYIAQAIRAQPARQEPDFWTAFHKGHGFKGGPELYYASNFDNQKSLDEITRELGEKIGKAWEELIFRGFAGGL